MSLFGKAAAQGGGSLFGNSQQSGSSLFGNASNQSQQQGSGGNLFGNSQQKQQPDPSGNLFGNAQQSQQQRPAGLLFGGSQQQQQQEPRIGSIWTDQTQQSRQKPIAEQIKLVCDKWNPATAPAFGIYLYNTVPAEQAAFYRAGPGEDEDKWEEALAKAPTPGAIPVRVRGFQQLGERVVEQTRHLQLLRGRLHEVVAGLDDLLRRHELEVAARATACRRAHARLAQRCLALATKVQVLRNRGYVLDAPEEALRQRLGGLERRVMDPALASREEEVWARMVALRERSIVLEDELKQAGDGVGHAPEGKIDEEILKRARKILEDYDSQMKYVLRELKLVSDEFEEEQKPR